MTAPSEPFKIYRADAAKAERLRVREVVKENYLHRRTLNRGLSTSEEIAAESARHSRVLARIQTRYDRQIEEARKRYAERTHASSGRDAEHDAQRRAVGHVRSVGVADGMR